MSKSVCRWGVLGAAVIAKKNWQAIHLSGNGQLAAVACRSPERGRAWVNECQSSCPLPHVPDVCGYEELLARPDIDAVYIPLPTGVRCEWVLKAAAAGKHVMCEKPCGANADEVQQMVEACRQHNVQFMDGVMFMHSQRLRALRDALDDNTNIGKIKRITSQFSFRAGEEFKEQNIRVNSQLEPLGCLGDLGWYTIRFALWAMRYELPTHVTGRLLAQHGRADSPDSVPMEFTGELFFKDGVSASYYTSFLTENQQWANISGSHGFIHVRDFVLPYFGGSASFDVVNSKFDVHGCDFNMHGHTRTVSSPEYSNSYPDAQEVNLFRNFAALVTSGRLDAHWPDIALKTQRVMDACLNSARNGSRDVAIA